MKVKIIPIMLLLLFSMATPVFVSMAIPKKAEKFYVKAVMEPVFLDASKGVQKYPQSGELYDEQGGYIGTIDLQIIITNVDKALSGKCARARVHFIMQFDDGTTISGTIVGKAWFDAGWVQHIEGIFVGRGSHVKGTVHMIAPDVVVFEGMKW